MLKRKADPIVSEIWYRASEYGLRSMVQIADACGIPYHILIRRMESPETFKVCELRRLHDTIKIDLGMIANAIEKGSIRR